MSRKCICKGNWRLIVSEIDSLIGKKFVRNHDGKTYTLFGAVHGRDDYYYGFYRKGKTILASCVGSIESNGFTPK